MMSLLRLWCMRCLHQTEASKQRLMPYEHWSCLRSQASTSWGASMCMFASGPVSLNQCGSYLFPSLCVHKSRRRLYNGQSFCCTVPYSKFVSVAFPSFPTFHQECQWTIITSTSEALVDSNAIVTIIHRLFMLFLPSCCNHFDLATMTCHEASLITSQYKVINKLSKVFPYLQPQNPSFFSRSRQSSEATR